MNMQKGILLGLVGALLAGGIEAAAEAGWGAQPAESESALEFTVPNARIGDQVLYANFERTGAEGEWRRVADSGFKVAPMQKLADHSRVVHDVVPVHLGRETGWYGRGILGIESAWGHNYTYLEYLDLATKDKLGAAQDGMFNTTTAFKLNAQQRYATVFYGPGPSAQLFGPARNATDANFVSQGRTYAAGQDAQSESVEILASESLFHLDSLGPQWGNLTFHDASVKGRIARAATIAGLPALDHHIEGCFGVAVGPEPWGIESSSPYWFMGIRIPIPSTICFEVHRWLSPERPYPILVERHLTINGKQQVSALASLADYRAGSTLVPWGEGPQRNAAPEGSIERSPASQRHPADGSNPVYGYRLSDAKASVESDLGMVRFQTWRAAHPDAMLIGARLRPTGNDLAGRLWTLVYGVPSGADFVVSTERRQPTLPARNGEIGEIQGPSFTLDQFPPAPLTLSTGVAMYHRYVEPSTTPAPNMVSWGFRYVPPTVWGWTSPEFLVGTPFVFYVFTHVGYMSEPVASDQARVDASLDLEASRWIMYRTENGDLVWSLQASSAEPYTPLPSVSGLTPNEPTAPKGTGSVPSPDLTNAALVSTSLFALFLAVYFFPLLKWAGASVTAMVPGYAKLAKSKLLDNKVRETMVQAIRDDPGVTPPQLQELTGAAWSTVVYHLGVLEKNQIVSSLIDGRHKRFFPYETVNWSDRGRIAVLKNVKSREMYEILLQEPGLGPNDLSQRVGITRGTVYWHTNRLQKAGLVGRDRAGLRTVFFANPKPEKAYDSKDAIEVV